MTGGESTFLLWLLFLIAVITGIMLSRQVSQRRQLRHWLDDPAGREIPEGHGPWRDIFSQLQRLRKEDQRKHAALGVNLNRFHQAAQALPDGVVLLDAEGRIDWLNHAAGAHFGLDPARDIGTLIGQLIRHSSFHAHLAAFHAGEDAAPLVFQVGTESARRTLSVLLIAFANTGILLLSRDISEIARVETVRRDFIANVSHELRTPLTVISGFLEHLTAEDAPLDPSSQRSLTLMAEQAQRMNRLVEDLLTLSRLENAAEPPGEDRIDVPALLQTMHAEARALSEGKHSIELEHVEARCLRGSADEIRSAFSNLVSNAIRYTPPGGRIGLAWQAQGDYLVFSVTDTGIGIPSEHIQRLTERFYRVDKGRSTATGGTGLGLAIVKHILARHQGTLDIRSEVGRGSTFSAQLPLSRAIQ